MNIEIKKKLQELAAAAEKVREAEQLKPSIISKAESEYTKFGQQLNDSVTTFNDDADSQQLLLKIKIDRTTDQRGLVVFVLKLLRDGRADKRSVLEITMPPSIESGFSQARIIVKEWTYNHTVENVTRALFFTPGEEPKPINEAIYRLNIAGKAYEWVPENANDATVGASFSQLVDSVIYDKLVSKL